MLDPLVLAALVQLIKVILDTYFPNVPITIELINAILVIILGWFGLEVVKAGARRYAPQLYERGLLKKDK